ncbi:MAG: TAXI family TRAP transporter solute-binding subunit [Planctomycetota bacterium]
MTAKDDRLEVGAGIPLPALIGAIVTGLAIFAVVRWSQSQEEGEQRRELVIATGPEAGTYHALGTALETLLEKKGIVDDVKVVSTAGSVENMAGLRGGSRFDIAFVQGDTPPVAGARLLTTLHREALHVLVSRDAAGTVDSIDDLTGRPVVVGPRNSGTQQLAVKTLDHFDVKPSEKLELTPKEASDALDRGEVDAVFFLTSVPSAGITTLAARGGFSFLSLGDSQLAGNEADALALVLPSVEAFIIPRATYRMLPASPTATVAVPALLVAREELDVDLVKEITEAVLVHQCGADHLDGEARVIAQGISESFEPAASPIPYHPGAASYYSREQPPFMVEYAEAISLGLTLLVGLYSAYVTLREWARRRRKNRIDRYLVRVEQLTAHLDDQSLEELLAHRDDLDTLRRRAFSDLVKEKLVADESFTIFQNHLRDEFAAVEARIKEMGAVAAT